MLQKLRGSNTKGFTLIELMIVIAIIGILAAIAIPNFISYRNKSFCSQAESDADNIKGALADHFAIITHTALPSVADLDINLKNESTALSGSVQDVITIEVTDESSRCPLEYQAANTDVWSNAVPGVVTKTMD